MGAKIFLSSVYYDNCIRSLRSCYVHGISLNTVINPELNVYSLCIMHQGGQPDEYTSIESLKPFNDGVSSFAWDVSFFYSDFAP